MSSRPGQERARAVVLARRLVGGRVLFVLVALAALAMPVMAPTSGATFTAVGSVLGNTFTADTLAAPTSFAAAVSNGQVTLTWTPTVSSYADGYKIYRASATTGPWTEIATVTGATAATWTDTNPAAGTNYYVAKTYRYNWISGQTQTGSGTVVALALTDTFAGTNGTALGPVESNSAYTWQPLTGTWTRTNGNATTTTATTSNPLAVIDTGTPNVDESIQTPVGSGEALYFRVTDANDWLRARVRHYTTTTTGGYYEWQPTAWSSAGMGSGCVNSSGRTTEYSGQLPNEPSQPSQMTTFGANSSCYVGSPYYYWGQTYQSWSRSETQVWVSTTTTNNYWEVDVEKDVAGAISSLAAYSVAKPSSLRVVCSGTGITTYASGSTTALGTVTDATNQTATQHGIGLGGTTTSPTTYVGDFSVKGL